MIVSWNWLKQYVNTPEDRDEVEHRLMMAGLNHEGTEEIDGDFAIDLEVTSNRPDCLGHIGVAREIGVLYGRELCLPLANPAATAGPAGEQVQVAIECPDLCKRYTARVIKGVKIGPSPDWLVERLTAVGIGVVNNVVDITNYVLMECGQPLHAFDLAKLSESRICVREAKKGEPFTAIDHRTYELEPGMCVIADGARAVALGGVMGGADTEVSETTTDLLIEAADFSQLSVRSTARKLNLHSPSSYRFERGVDPQGVDWASRRCCELILEIAGGELADGMVDVGAGIQERTPVELRFSQVERVLGIVVPQSEVRRILVELGCEEVAHDEKTVQVIPPSWRRDLTREIDLIEEVARIYGYEKIPEDASVPMWPSHRSDEERALDKTRSVLLAAGFDEALTASVVPVEWSEACTPWSPEAPLRAFSPMKGVLADAPKELGQADLLRRSLIPSLLEAKRYNESVSNTDAELFEVAKVYLPAGDGLPREQLCLSLVSNRDFLELKGVVETLLSHLNPELRLAAQTPAELEILDGSASCTLLLGKATLGYLGEVSQAALKQFRLRTATTVAEINLEVATSQAELIPQYVVPNPFPSMTRDLNLIVNEQVTWSDLESAVEEVGGEFVESVTYQETYRDPERDGKDAKRLLFSFSLRAADRTLTGEEADALRDKIVQNCEQKLGAKLVG